MTGPTILIVPGLRDHVPAHWQTLLAARLDRVGTVPPMGRADLDCRAKVEAIEREARAIDGRLVDLGEVGHLNPASGYGEWPDAEVFVRELTNGEWGEISRAVAALGVEK